jgi:hypothetical protein
MLRVSFLEVISEPVSAKATSSIPITRFTLAPMLQLGAPVSTLADDGCGDALSPVDACRQLRRPDVGGGRLMLRSHYFHLGVTTPPTRHVAVR